MNPSTEQAFSRDSFLGAIKPLAAKRKDAPQSDALTSFLDQYLADAFLEDFLQLTLEDAASLALDLWAFNAASEKKSERSIRTRRVTGANGKPLKMAVAEIVGPDLAFLVDSAIAAMQDARIEVRAVLHPIVDGPTGKRSTIQIHMPAVSDEQLAALQKRLEETFSDVAAVNADHIAMQTKMRNAADGLAGLKVTAERTQEEISEAREFLAWLAAENFTFLGARDYVFARDGAGYLANDEPEVEAGSGLGILRDPSRNVLSRAAEPTVLTAAIRTFLNEPSPIIVAKASFVSHVHRRTHADYVGVKRYDARGEVTGETRFVGLFTSEAYTRTADEVPLIRRKIEKVKALSMTGSRFSMKQLET
ncbi:MAG TPA: NAD-glutamate dehydrogenase, partial [Hyphomonadaceae bacterium]|nr:NAD-glutamate dehydrogenase [Hyphomonadaceae bacterium]